MRRTLLSLLLMATAAALSAAEALPPPAARQVDFGSDVLPLLKTHCFDCHAGREAESGYRLDLRAEILGETNGEPLVIVGKSEASKLVLNTAAREGNKHAMPPKDAGRALTADEIGVLRAWIDQGLPWDDNLLPPDFAKSSHWAFQPIVRPAVPPTTRGAWQTTPVDAFIAAQYEAHELAPLAAADRRTLLRRVTLDLTGLPPTPEEVAAFVADARPDAYERVVDRLLASPRYGERWGRHWLDVARYADSEGYESNHPRPYAWKYRDWVVNAVNSDKPYDDFLREQIAGDELTPRTDEHLIATGFLAAARLSSNEEDKALQRSAVLVDIVNATASGILGLTLHCAECHNHKFDPLAQRDYYALMAYFVRGQTNNLALRDPAGWEAYDAAKPAEYDPALKLKQAIHERTRTKLLRERREKLSEAQRAAYDKPAAERTPAEQKLAHEADLQLQLLDSQVKGALQGEDLQLYELLTKKLTELEKQMPDPPQTWGYYSPATSPHAVEVLPMKGFYPLTATPNELKQMKSYIFIRGDVHRRGPEVAPAWPAVLGETPPSADGSRTSLADWLTQRQHPLTARVWVNRLWQQHFGVGIVASSDDFGIRGEKPTHPQLLDYLALELIDSGWSTKHVQRLIVLSSVYRLASRVDGENAALAAANHQRDPENHLLWRFAPRRLEAEAIRDGVLAVSGELDLRSGGAPESDELAPRRTIYLLQKREAFVEAQRIFDGPTANESCSRRTASTVALQPLYMLNGKLLLSQAERFAARVKRLAGDDRAVRIENAFQLALGRAPDEREWAAAATFLQDDDSDRTLAAFCQALLNLNEFVYLE